MDSFSSFIETLKKGLNKPLPGESVHAVMEASSAKYLGVKPTEKTRKSAILLLLYPFENDIYFPLILRNSYDGFHSGEIGFPGGRQELTDADLIETALREAKEEIGINPNEVTILGTLTELYTGPSDFIVLPVVGCIGSKPEFHPDPREVKHIFEPNLNYFTDLKTVGCSEIQIPGDLVTTPYYELEGHKVWGATAKIIIELLAILEINFPDAAIDSVL